MKLPTPAPQGTYSAPGLVRALQAGAVSGNKAAVATPMSEYLRDAARKPAEEKPHKKGGRPG